MPAPPLSDKARACAPWPVARGVVGLPDAPACYCRTVTWTKDMPGWAHVGLFPQHAYLKVKLKLFFEHACVLRGKKKSDAANIVAWSFCFGLSHFPVAGEWRGADFFRAACGWPRKATARLPRAAAICEMVWPAASAACRDVAACRVALPNNATTGLSTDGNYDGENYEAFKKDFTRVYGPPGLLYPGLAPLVRVTQESAEEAGVELEKPEDTRKWSQKLNDAAAKARENVKQKAKEMLEGKEEVKEEGELPVFEQRECIGTDPGVLFDTLRDPALPREERARAVISSEYWPLLSTRIMPYKLVAELELLAGGRRAVKNLIAKATKARWATAAGA